MNSKIEIDPYLNEYLKIYQENPRSRVFAPLAESYRKSNFLDEAIEICKEGLTHHPNFVGGLVALARSYFDKTMYNEALTQLENAVSQAPDNYLAQKLMAESYFLLNDYQSSLKSYKVLNFINPKNNNIKNKISDLEFLIKQNEQKVKKEPEPIVKEEIPPVPYNFEEKFFDEKEIQKDLEKNIEYTFEEKPLSKLFKTDIDFNSDAILEEFNNHTLAGLLEKQGYKDKALAMYKNILNFNPKDLAAKEAINRLMPKQVNIKMQEPKIKETKQIIVEKKNIKTMIVIEDKEEDANWLIPGLNPKIELLNKIIKQAKSYKE